MVSLFQRATRKQTKARIGLVGPAGSGKTFTALRFAMTLAKGGKVAVIDTEHGSASKYAGDTDSDGQRFEFDVVDLGTLPGQFSVENYIRCMREAAKAGYSVLVIDSLSHAWSGPGGILEFVDQQAAKNRGNSFAGWRDATPLHNSLINELLSSPCHLIVTMRAKTEWVMETDSRGKTVPRKVGLQPVQRDGLEYEFDIVGDIEVDTHKLMVTKSRCSAVAGAVIRKPGKEFAEQILAWLESGEEAEKPEAWEDVAGEWQARLAAAGLPLEGLVAPWCAANGKPHPRDLSPAARRAALVFFEGDGAERIKAWGRSAVDELKRAFFKRWNDESSPFHVPTQKSGATKEEQDEARARSEEARRVVMSRWWGVQSFGDVQPAQAVTRERFGIAWMRGIDNEGFNAAVMDALNAESAA